MFLTKSLSIIYDLFDKYIEERTKYLRNGKDSRPQEVINELLRQSLMSKDQMSRLVMMNVFLPPTFLNIHSL